MKKSELLQITQIIEVIVAKEIRKQLPTIIAETFKNMMGRTMVTDSQPLKHAVIHQQIQENNSQEEVEYQDDRINLKSSLRELFAGTSVMQPPQPQIRQPKQFTKNPILNQILNETVPDLRSRERMTGMAAFQGGYNPSGFNSETSVAQAEQGTEPSFMRNVPIFNNKNESLSSIPIGNPPALIEGQTSTHAPLSSLPDGISVLDVARQGATPTTVTHALTRNYSQMLKLIDKKKGKVL